jgi:uncharacterized membrane protein YeiH
VNALQFQLPAFFDLASVLAGRSRPTRAYQMHLSVAAAVLVGVVNAVGGGLLRDVLVNKIWMMPGQLLAIAALIGAVIFVTLVETTPIGASGAAWIAIGVTFVVRVQAIRYDWRKRALLPENELEPN